MNLKSLYNSTVQESADQELDKDELCSWEVSNTQYFTELNPALKAIDAKLQEYRQKFKGAAIVTLQSDLTPGKLQFIGMPTLINEFPVLTCA